MRTRQSVGTGFAQTTSAGVEVNLRSSLASLARSCTITPSIRSASTWADYQPERLRPPSWGLISAFAAMRQGGFECSSGFGETSAVFQDERTVPTIVFHGDRDAIV